MTVTATRAPLTAAPCTTAKPGSSPGPQWVIQRAVRPRGGRFRRGTQGRADTCRSRDKPGGRALREKPVTKGHTEYDSVHRKSPEWVNPHRQDGPDQPKERHLEITKGTWKNP